ncbi:MAG: hypothetical protein NWQ16_10310 [Akkermansiaceae bacterium]|nr:hypothetical protein [Akkermansiaceae bacterium]
MIANRISIFFAAVTIIATGIAGLSLLEKDPAIGFLSGALTLGGGILICGLFTLKMPWHGIAGAGVLALLGLCRGIMNLPDLPAYLSGVRERGNAPVLELAVTLICAILLIRMLRALSVERTRRMLAED